MKSNRTTILDVRNGISPEIHDSWQRIQSQNAALGSPFFSPEFTRIVAMARSGVEMAVMDNGNEIVAILPFERLRWKTAGPVGAFLSDCHGVICQADFALDLRQLLRECGLAALNFSYTPASHQVSLVPFQRKQYPSPIIDVSTGYETYCMERRAAGTELIKKNANLLRRIEREVGPVRFVVHSPDVALLNQLFTWKSDQYRRNRWRDCFAIPWVRQTIEAIHAVRSPGFGGLLSVLYAGDQLVAAHFGMRSATTWHYWFPSYDHTFAKYSPGVMLLLKMAEAAPAMGIKIIDMGCGEHSYKWRLMNGFIPTALVSLELTCPTTFARRTWTSLGKLPRKARRVLSKTPIGVLARCIRDGISFNAATCSHENSADASG